MSVATSIAPWGNSEAIRIPKSLLRMVGLANGDRVKLETTSRGSIEIIPIKNEHRRVQPKPGITFSSLFAGYETSELPVQNPWPSEDLIGAEFDAWGQE